MSLKRGDPIDVHVGNRLRAQRVAMGLSQERLGALLGLTFQQIQKYEKGSNRIGAGRLFHIAQILGVSVQFFYEDVPADSRQHAAAFEDESFVMDYVATPEGIQLNQHFFQIPDAGVRRRVLGLVKILAEGEDGRQSG